MVNTEEKKISMVDGIRHIRWQVVLICLMSFFMGRVCVMNAYYTIAVAYVTALFYDKQTRRWSAILAILGIISVGTVRDANVIKYIITIIVLEAFRELMSSFNMKAQLKNQLVISTISIAIVNIMLGILGSMTTMKALMIICETMICILITIMLNNSLEYFYNNKTSIMTQQEVASMVFYIVCIISGMIDFSIVLPYEIKIYLKDVLIFLLLIGVSYLGGSSHVAVAAIITCSVLVLFGYLPTNFVIVYVFASMLGGLARNLDKIGIIFVSALGMMGGFVLFNNNVIDWNIMSAYAVAGTISLFIPKSYFGANKWFIYSDNSETITDISSVQRLLHRQLDGFSRAFDNLSVQFKSIHQNAQKFDITDRNAIIDQAAESMCSRCSSCNFCWKDYLNATYTYNYQMLDILDRQGEIRPGDIPPGFMSSCSKSEKYVYVLSSKYDLYRQALKWKNNFQEARSLIATEFKAVADSIEELSSNINREIKFNKEQEKSIRTELLRIGVKYKNVMVVEKEGKLLEVQITCYHKAEPSLVKAIVKLVSAQVGVRCEITNNEFSRGAYTLIIVPKKIYKVDMSVKFIAKENICGDTYSYTELDNGKCVIALSDGMGCGMEAAKESRLAVDLLENFMQAEFDVDNTLNMINSALVLRSEIENSATMDLVIVDRYTGEAEFIKMGASTSFIIRRNEDGTLNTIEEVTKNSYPMGIVPEVDYKKYSTKLGGGDVIIMVTDGVLDSKSNILDRKATFKQFIEESADLPIENMVKYLLNSTRSLITANDRDDMTIAAIRMEKLK